MNIYKDVSISHTSTSESAEEGGGEGVETTLKVLAALKCVQDNVDVPTSPASGKSRANQSATNDSKKLYEKCFVEAQENAKQRNSGLRSMSSMSSSHKHRKGQYPAGIEPLSPQRKMEPQMPPPTEKRGGLFSCCFRANEQVVVQDPPRQQGSKESQGYTKTYQHQVYPKNNGKENEEEEEEGEDGDPPGLTEYERAMIQRLRELLSLDTTVPTLPTHIQVNDHKGSPVSLDITDSMIANTFSIDTKELQSVLQGEQNKSVAEMAESVRSKGLASQTKSQKSYSLPLDSRQRSSSSSIVQGIQHPPSMQSSTKHGAGSTNEGSVPRSGSTTRSRKTNASKQPSTTGQAQSIQKNVSNISESRSAAMQQGTDTALHRVPSNGSKASSKASSHSSRKGSNIAVSRQPSISEHSRNLTNNKGLGRSGSFSGSKGVPPKPESDGSSQAIKESLLALKKSSSIKSGSTGAKSKKSYTSHDGLSNQSLKINSKCSSSSREMSVMPDMPTCRTNSGVSIKRSKSSKSTSTSASVGQVSKQPSLRYSSSNASSHHSLHRRPSHESNVEETRQEVEAPRAVLPPRPEAQRKRKDPMETIVAAYSHHREEPDEYGEDGGFECIYPVDVEEDPPELEATHSEDVVRKVKYQPTPRHMRRATSEIVRVGPIQPIRRTSSRESSSNVLGNAILDGNAALGAPKDIRDDISDLGMLSPKRMANAATKAQDDEEKENVVGGAVVVGSEPRKMDMLDMFSGGFFCLGGNNAAGNAVL